MAYSESTIDAARLKYRVPPGLAAACSAAFLLVNKNGEVVLAGDEVENTLLAAGSTSVQTFVFSPDLTPARYLLFTAPANCLIEIIMSLSGGLDSDGHSTPWNGASSNVGWVLIRDPFNPITGGLSSSGTFNFSGNDAQIFGPFCSQAVSQIFLDYGDPADATAGKFFISVRITRFKTISDPPLIP